MKLEAAKEENISLHADLSSQRNKILDLMQANKDAATMFEQQVRRIQDKAEEDLARSIIPKNQEISRLQLELHKAKVRAGDMERNALRVYSVVNNKRLAFVPITWYTNTDNIKQRKESNLRFLHPGAATDRALCDYYEEGHARMLCDSHQAY